MNTKHTQAYEKIKQEMRRGTVILAALSQLSEAQYGYSLIQSLNEKGYEIGQDTLYPLLRRLEQQGLLDSEWRVEDPRPRRYYTLNAVGQEVLNLLIADWKNQENVLRSLLS
ncbi:MAG: helix-turn-helix transcriptional regulator [Anaerolineaceae bacterium]|nr:helix-turn-helix transcriptional regulator [Anaerolineaceae bacterium]